MAKTAHTTSTPTTSRRTLGAGLLAIAAAAGITPDKAAAEPDGETLATSADYASVDFEPVPGLAESLGSRAEWLAKMGNRYPTLWIGGATMRMTPQELTDMASKEPDAIAEMISCILDLQESLEAESAVMKAAAVRLIAGCCRAGLV